MPEYEVDLYYTGFITRTVNAENEEEAVEKARAAQDSPCNQETFIRRFEPILETLQPWKDCDTAELKKSNPAERRRSRDEFGKRRKSINKGI
jgi:hypothetical protein